MGRGGNEYMGKGTEKSHGWEIRRWILVILLEAKERWSIQPEADPVFLDTEL
jgi:hypothetical protein